MWQNVILYLWLKIIILSFGNGKTIKISFLSCTFWNSFKDFLVLLVKLKILWALISPRYQYLLKISTLSCSENLEKYFSLQAAPQGGRIFRLGISVPLLKVLYVCHEFRNSIVLFLFYSDGMVLFLFLLFIFLSLWSNLCFVVHSMQKRCPHQMKNSCYQKCLNKKHHLMNNSGRRLSHQFQMLIPSLVKL